MLHEVRRILGMEIIARDGSLGRLQDLLFDESDCRIHFLVVVTDGLRGKQRVQLPRTTLGRLTWDREVFRLPLKRAEINLQSGAASARSVSEQKGAPLSDYYGVPRDLKPPRGPGREEPPLPDVAEQQPEPSGLRAATELIGYACVATDGDVGRVADLVLDDGRWRLEYLDVDTDHWLPGRHARLLTSTIAEIDWLQQVVRLEVTRRYVEESKAV